MRELRQSTWLLPALLLLSGVGHLWAYLGLGLLPTDVQFTSEPHIVEIVAVTEPEPIPEEPELPPPPPPPEPEPEIPTPRAPRVDRSPLPQPATPAPEVPPDEPPPPAEEAIAEFMGDTFTNETGASFAAPVGNGQEITGASGQPGAQVTGRRVVGVAGGTPGGQGGPSAPPGPQVVAFRDLSRQPGARSDLDSLLQRNYPSRARQLGIEGGAVVGFRIMPNGRTANVRVRSQTPVDQGFGAACQRAVQQAEFEPPLAANGDAVATDTTLNCEFTLQL